ncbi:MAG: NAD-dependent epimerase/dehydratase family protein, partial [Betaproteobacteria bacterium]|nr:NAD-dependent epimerase/dehydratase family protein [Betaproteobacteria bacterium]
MKILVTGAAGQLGSALLRALASRTDTTEIVAVDQHPLATDSPKLRVLTGDLTAPGFARGLVDRGTATVFHLASLVSGGAEQDFELGTRVNLDATRELLEACRIAGHAPRFVFTSSIAVYGGTLPDPVTDDTPALPRLSYGAQKLACEILINDYTRRGFLVGATLRLPAVLVRGGGPNSAVSGWTSALIREPLAGRDYVCPVAARTRQPCISARRAVESLIAASRLDPGALGHDRSVLLAGVTA